MRAKLGIVLLLFVVFFHYNIKAQVTVSMKIDTNMLLIGDQVNLELEATFPDSTQVFLPIFSDTIIDKLEILDISNIDTVFSNGIYKIHQKYLVTSFDSGLYTIPPAKFVVNFIKGDFTDTLESSPIYFGVMTMKLDTANTNAITDIKLPIEAPITFKEVMPFIGIGLGVLLLIFIIYIFYIKYTKKESVFIKKEKPKEPAHIVALRNLDILKNEKLWQKGKVKKYYSELTDIVRVYIEDRFNINAMESTTEEIIDAFKQVDIDKQLKIELFDMLKAADFVKFAKATPLADENEKNLEFVYQIVEKTKLVEKLIDEDNESEDGESNEQQE